MKENIKFMDEIYPISRYADEIERKYYFLGYCGNSMKGYAEIMTVQILGNGFNKDGIWTEKIGTVKQCISYVPIQIVFKINQN